MLHFPRAGRFLACLLILIFAAGCGPNAAKNDNGGSAPGAAKNALEPKPPLPVAGTVQDLDLTLLDKDGVTVARVKAKAGAIGQTDTSGEVAGILVGSATPGTPGRPTATLYEKGEAAATITADRVTADQASKTVVATGGAVVRSLTRKGSPTVRADRVTWRHGENKVYGQGNVLITQDPDFRMPGTSFVADTRLQTVEVRGDGKPITGRL